MIRRAFLSIDILILAMIFSGSLAVTGDVSEAYAGEESSEKSLELPDTDRKALAILGKGVVGRALAAVPIKDSAKLMPLKAGKWTYQIVSGSRVGERQEDFIERPKHDSTGRSWRRIVGKKFIEYFRVDDRKRIDLASEADLVEDVITQYAPSFAVIVDGMRPGETRSVQTDIKVYDLHNPSHEKYKGLLRVTHTYVGAYELVVPAGRYRAVLIKSTYNGKVGPATVNDVGYVFYAAGEGIVAAVARAHVSAFLFYDKRTRTAKVLMRRETY